MKVNNPMPAHPPARSLRYGVRTALLGTLALAALFLPGCDEQDAASIQLKLNKDLSGTIVASGIVAPAEARPVEQATTGSGVTWQGRAGILVSRGGFAKVADLNIGGITFEPAGAGSVATTGVPRPCLVKVSIPRGKAAQWPTLLAGKNEAERDTTRKLLQPDLPATDLAKTIKLTIRVPGKVLGSGISARARGLSADKDDTLAILIVPLDLAQQEGEPLIWHVSWEEK